MNNAMPGRPMRLAGREVKGAAQLREIVDACQTVRIAAVDNEGVFIVPMSFGYDWADPADLEGSDEPRFALWVHSAVEGRIRLMYSMPSRALRSRWTFRKASSREITRVHTRMPIDRSWGRERCIGFSRPR